MSLLLVVGSVLSSESLLLRLRGGLVPQASDNPASRDYYEQFELDYGCQDNQRLAGSMRGFIKNKKLSELPTSDPFIKWLNEHLEIGREDFSGRIKPYYVSKLSML